MQVYKLTFLITRSYKVQKWLMPHTLLLSDINIRCAWEHTQFTSSLFFVLCTFHIFGPQLDIAIHLPTKTQQKNCKLTSFYLLSGGFKCFFLSFIFTFFYCRHFLRQSWQTKNGLANIDVFSSVKSDSSVWCKWGIHVSSAVRSRFISLRLWSHMLWQAHVVLPHPDT